MTLPGNPVPLPDGSYTVRPGQRWGQDQTEQGIRQGIRDKAIGGFGQGQDNLWGEGGFLGLLIGALTNGLFFNLGGASTYTAEQYETMNDHTEQITALVAAFDQLTLQGNAIVFNSNNTWYPSAKLVSADVVILGGGGGGGAGKGTSGNSSGAGGGGGGGTVVTNIPGSFLPKTGEVYDGVPIYVGAGGSAGTTQAGVGGGGGNSAIDTYLTAGGGGGGGGSPGSSTALAPGGSGGAGSPRGGNGGNSGGFQNVGGSLVMTNAGHGLDSTSEYSLAGGGGGGGGGQGDGTSGVSQHGRGGQGGISPGGNSPGQSGSPPSAAVTTGGGGGAGGARIGSGNPLPGGAGAYPSGGGGGGGVKGGSAAGGQWSVGGIGGAGRIFVIERFI